MLGPHLTIDIYECEPEKLDNSEFIYQLLIDLPTMIGMNIFSEPQVTCVPEQGPKSFDKGGVTGFVILVESHISIHTFPADKYASIDIFSCKPFSKKKAITYITRVFGAKRAETNSLTRGRTFTKHYPRQSEKAQEIALKERTTR